MSLRLGWLLVQISNGGAWVTARSITNGSAGWNAASFNVGDFVTPNSTVQVRFQCSDNPNNSLTEAAIDDVVVQRVECEATDCFGDLNGDSQITGADLGLLIAAWGTPDGDLNDDGTTNGADLGLLVAAFGNDC